MVEEMKVVLKTVGLIGATIVGCMIAARFYGVYVTDDIIFGPVAIIVLYKTFKINSRLEKNKENK